jgi:hypothetical protein
MFLLQARLLLGMRAFESEPEDGGKTHFVGGPRLVALLNHFRLLLVA